MRLPCSADAEMSRTGECQATVVGIWDNVDRGFPKLFVEEPMFLLENLCPQKVYALDNLMPKHFFWTIVNHSKIFIFWNIQEFSIFLHLQNFHILDDSQMITFLIILSHSGPFHNFHIQTSLKFSHLH